MTLQSNTAEAMSRICRWPHPLPSLSGLIRLYRENGSIFGLGRFELAPFPRVLRGRHG